MLNGNIYMDNRDFNEVVGLKRAVVMDLNDPKRLNRVKLKFVDENIESVYAPVISSTAGNKVKTVAIPSKDDEVLVGFLDGKISEPVIIGSLYNDPNKAPVKIDTAKNEVVTIKLSTNLCMTVDVSNKNSKIDIKTSKGNTITLEDGTKQCVTISGVKGKKENVRLDVNFKDGKIGIFAEKSISLKSGVGGASISLSDGSIYLDAKKVININSKNNINVSANAKGVIKGNSVDIKGISQLGMRSMGRTKITGTPLQLN